jgi:hypothetical protein
MLADEWVRNSTDNFSRCRQSSHCRILERLAQPVIGEVPLSPALLSAQIKRLVSGRLVHLWPYRRGFVCREWAHLLLGPFFRKRSGQPRGVRTAANADQYPGTTYSTSAVLRAPSYS